MSKIISYLAIVVLSVAGFCAAAKETSTTPQTTLASVEAKTTALAKVVEKTEEIKVSTLEKIEKQLNELDVQKNERTKIEIERDRKSIEFWFAALAILTGIVAAIGAILPYFMGRKERERLQVEYQEALDLNADARRSNEEARRLVESIKGKHAEAEKFITQFGLTSGNEPQVIDKATVQAEIKAVKEHPERYTDADILRARAVEASLENNPSEKQALYAYDLWKSFSVLKPEDSSAQQNAGYWAQKLAEKNEPPSATYWYKQAYERYTQALRLKPENHQAAYNWGISLGSEAHTLAATDPATAHKKWQHAVELLRNLELLAPTRQVYYNLACFLSRLELLDESLSKLEIARFNGQLPSHWENDDDLINLRETETYKTWYKTHFGDDKT
jgi:hypothetical protein